MSNKIEEVIYSRLSGDSGVTAIVSDKIFPVVMPEGFNLPCLVYSLGVGTTSPSKDQASEIDQGTFTVDALSHSRNGTNGYNEAGDLIEVARKALDKVTGTVASVEVLNVEPVGTPEDIFNENGNDDGTYGKSQEFYYAISRN